MNREGPAVLTDVATRAGVPVSTALRALRRPEMVRPETRARVRRAARELGYHDPDPQRRWRTHRSRVIGLLLPDAANPCFATIRDSVRAEAHARGYEVVMVETNGDAQCERVLVAATARWAEGIVITGAVRPHPPNSNGTPMVFVNRHVPGSHAVVIDQRHVVETQIGHLLDLGHERILYVDGPADYWASEVRRRRVARLAAQHDIRLAPKVSDDLDGGAHIADIIDDDITAIAVFNGPQAKGFIRRAAEHGIQVPEDVSVIGSDESPDSAMITTYRSPKEAIGRAAVSLIVDHATSDGPEIVEMVRGGVLVRETTAAPNAARRDPRLSAARL